MDHRWTIDRPTQTIDTNKQTINRLQMDHKQISFLRLCTKLSFTFSFKIIIYNISTLKTTLQSCVNLLYDLKIHSHNFQYLNQIKMNNNVTFKKFLWTFSFTHENFQKLNADFLNKNKIDYIFYVKRAKIIVMLIFVYLKLSLRKSFHQLFLIILTSMVILGFNGIVSILLIILVSKKLLNTLLNPSTPKLVFSTFWPFENKKSLSQKTAPCFMATFMT